MPISTLTMHFFENIPNEEFKRITSKLTETAEMTTWSGVYLHAVSGKDRSIDVLLNLAVELCAFCHVHYEEPIFDAVLLHRNVDWNWRNIDMSVLDKLEEISSDSEGLVPRGYLAVPMHHQGEVLDFLFNHYPGLTSISGLSQLGTRINRISGPSLVGMDLWSILERQNDQNQILLASELSVQISDSYSERLKELIFELNRKPKIINELDWRKVEELVAGLIEDKGYRVELTKQTRDGGVDIFAFGGKGLIKDEKYIIEVKHSQSNNPVRVDAVAKLAGVGEVQPHSGLILVTTTRFTKDAIKFAEKLRHRLSLNDYYDLMGWVDEYCRKRKE